MKHAKDSGKHVYSNLERFIIMIIIVIVIIGFGVCAFWLLNQIGIDD